jgi:hypothetical protein
METCSAMESFATLTKTKKDKRRERRRRYVNMERPDGHVIHVELVAKDSSPPLTWQRILFYTFATGCCIIVAGLAVSALVTYYHNEKELHHEHHHYYPSSSTAAVHDNFTMPYTGVD